MRMKRTNAIIVGGIVLLVLAAAFFWGGDFAAKNRNGENLSEANGAGQLSGTAGGHDEASAETGSGADAVASGETGAAAGSETGTDAETTPGATASSAEAASSAADVTLTANATGSDTSAAAGVGTDAAHVAGTSGGTPPSASPATSAASSTSSATAASQEGAYHTSPIPAGKPAPVEPEAAKITETARTCTLSVVCDKVLENMDLLPQEKAGLIPDDGVIFPTTQVTFYEGESVFNVLLREMKKNKIHLEYVSTPIYNSAYIEGLNNIYEFDCGELSGWMFSVNGWFPNYGPSRYQLRDGDTIVWTFSCDLGRDVGSDYSAAEQR